MHRLVLTILVIGLNQVLPNTVNSLNCGVNLQLEELTDAMHFIVGGQVTQGPGTWPWVCSVGFHESAGWEHQCGGTLITYSHVLTAAHCPTDFKAKGKDDRIKVRCGDFHLRQSSDDGGVQVRDVSRYDIHERYNDANNYDISVLFMSIKFTASSFVRPICLASPIQEQTNTGVIVLGWGINIYGEHGAELNVAKLQILDQKDCKDAVVDVTGFGDELFCAVDQALRGSGSCYGDSGGPVFALSSRQHGTSSGQNQSRQFRYELKGLVSGAAECGVFESPDILTNTSYDAIHSWILLKTGGNTKKCKERHKCVPKADCPDIVKKFAVIENVSSEVELKEKALEDVKAQSCDEGQKLFCCSTERNSYHPDPEKEECEDKFASERLRKLFC